jgi:DNA-binding transcriptional MerR regulator
MNTCDQEWIELILEAMSLGLTVDEIKHFLKTGEYENEK